MVAETYLYDGTAFRGACTEIHIFDGSVYRDCQEVHVYDGSAWRLVFERTTVTISGETVSHVTSGTTAKAGIRVNTDGTIDKREGDTYTQIDASTDWIIPNGNADSTYDVRITSVNFTQGSGFDVEAATENTWVAMSANREWSIFDTDSNPAVTKTCSFTLEIRKDSGSVIDSATYTLNPDNTT